MKKQIMVLATLLLMFGIRVNCSNVINEDKVSFEELLGQSLSKVQTAPTSENLLNCVSELKRIDSMYPDNWLSRYYEALFDLRYCLFNLKSDTDNLMKEAEENIILLKKNKNADMSEIFTLEGMYYYTLIAKDPQKNGSIYYTNVFDSYNKALNFNSENPRAKVMLLTFKLQMSQFLGENIDNISDQLLDIKKLFEKQPEHTLMPSWGKSNLEQLMAQSKKE